MEFKFPVNDVFKQPIVEVKSGLLPPGFTGDRRAIWDTMTKVQEMVNAMGEASASAQGLTKPITTAEKLRNSEHSVYFLVDQNAGGGRGAITGMLKTGKKGLYVFDRNGQHFQMTPSCVLDFYIHESRQRQGLGKKLFEHMLESQAVEPVKMAIDRPSEKFLGFLHKHYSLANPVKQMNNFVVYDEFFPKSPERNGPVEVGSSGGGNSPCKKLSANGLQNSQYISPLGRYGAPRPPCSMGQIIHNQTSTIPSSTEPTGALETKSVPVLENNQNAPGQSSNPYYRPENQQHNYQQTCNAGPLQGNYQLPRNFAGNQYTTGDQLLNQPQPAPLRVLGGYNQPQHISNQSSPNVQQQANPPFINPAYLMPRLDQYQNYQPQVGNQIHASLASRVQLNQGDGVNYQVQENQPQVVSSQMQGNSGINYQVPSNIQQNQPQNYQAQVEQLNPGFSTKQVLENVEGLRHQENQYNYQQRVVNQPQLGNQLQVDNQPQSNQESRRLNEGPITNQVYNNSMGQNPEITGNQPGSNVEGSKNQPQIPHPMLNNTASNVRLNETQIYDIGVNQPCGKIDDLRNQHRSYQPQVVNQLQNNSRSNVQLNQVQNPGFGARQVLENVEGLRYQENLYDNYQQRVVNQPQVVNRLQNNSRSNVQLNQAQNPGIIAPYQALENLEDLRHQPNQYQQQVVVNQPAPEIIGNQPGGNVEGVKNQPQIARSSVGFNAAQNAEVGANKSRGIVEELRNQPQVVQSSEYVTGNQPGQNQMSETGDQVEDVEISSSPKLERPRSLSIQLNEDIEAKPDDVESKVEHVDEIEEIIEKLADVETNVETPIKRTTPSHLTDQGFFDLKFYHNKLW